MQRLYSPGQVAAATFLGGPLAASYMLNRNFIALGNPLKAKDVAQSGCWLTVILTFFLGLLSEEFSGFLLPFVFAFATYQYARNNQISKEEIEQSQEYQFFSDWNVLVVSVATLLIHIAFLCFVLSFYASVGILKA
ncbi:hypothetical protein [Photobacterium sp. 53610]|uniref:hypothetical protein n=1 Tax=Photobacterium sp. 53610 TaxID=3102789 RepID=UPI002EDAEAA4